MLSFKELNFSCHLLALVVTICNFNNIGSVDGARNFEYYPSPNDDGTLIPVRLSQPDHPPPRAYRLTNPKYYLYTKETVSKPVALFATGGNKDRIAKELEYFNPTAPWKILCHGFMSDSTKPFPQDIKNAYLRLDKAPNVILVDWGEFSGLPYYSATSNVPSVAASTARLIQTLVDEGVIPSLDHVHFIGHSLGAHIAGMTGMALQTGKLDRITGLDPAGPYYCGAEEKRLNPKCAKFVDVIHTDDGKACSWFSLIYTAVNQNFGNSLNLGTADFFPNGGVNQPGCSGLACGHARSYHYMEESIDPKHQFVATPCSTWDQFKRLLFPNSACTAQPRVLMGEYVSRTAKGTYYLRTGTGFPYSVV